MAFLSTKFKLVESKTADWISISYPPAAHLTTKRLIIRPMHIKDAEAMSKLANDELVSMNMTDRFPSPYKLEDAHTFIDHMQLKANSSDGRKPKRTHFAICLHEDPTQLIGVIGADDQPDVFRRGAEIGYWLGREYWGKAYMVEAVMTFVDWLFSLEYGLTGVEGESLLRISAGIFGHNSKSCQMLLKAGFTTEGTLKDAVWKQGKVVDLIMMALTKSQWTKR